MRILLIAPEQPGINSDPEVRYISAMHRVHVLAGRVSAQNLYEACQHNTYEILHIVDHNAQGVDRETPSKIPLSNGESLDAQDIVELAQACNAQGIFLNTCNSSFYASYAVRRGVNFSVFTTLEIRDNSAWKAPLVFYSALEQQEKAGTVDFYAAYLSLSDDGVYGWTSSRARYQSFLLAPVMQRFDDIEKQIFELKDTRRNDLDSVDQRLRERIRTELHRVRANEILWLAVALAVVLLVSVIGDVVMWNAIRGLAAGV